MNIPQGFRFSATNAGVKFPEETRLDMGLILCETSATASGVFTTNLVKAAPVLIGMDLVKTGRVRAVIANSGNANACTGSKGVEDALALNRAAAASLGIGEDEIIPLSTGVIGVGLPVGRMIAKMDDLALGLCDDVELFARSIMTTDTFPKISFRQAGNARVLGIAKGAGMIAPDMATTLAVVLTDACIDKQQLDNIIKKAIKHTFNAITIDGDTSTNDTLIALASGYLTENINIIERSIREVIHELAMMIVKDGEGATKFVRIIVQGAHDDKDAKTIAMNVANSLLVKTALFGCDPNWGRIIAAVGYSGVQVQPDHIDITIGDYPAVVSGTEAPGFSEETLNKILQEREILIDINVGNGRGTFCAYTTDLSYNYVKINSEYRT